VVAASLPGGDPLAAALAAGETPSPELVAASGDSGWLSPVVAGSCLAALAIVLAILVLTGERYNFVARAPLDKGPAVLKDRAQEIIRHLGYDETPADTAFGFQTEKDELDYISQQELPPGERDRWELLSTTPWTGITFWYRESPGPLFANGFWRPGGFNWGRVGYWEPWWHTPGMVGVRLHPQGGLRSFQALPPVTRIVDSEQITGDEQWSKWFPKVYIGFDLDELSPATWRQTPFFAFDRWQAWEGTWPDSDQPLYVMAAAYQGKPVYFEIVHPTRGPRQPGKNEDAGAQSATLGGRINELVRNLNVTVLFLLAVQTGAALLALRNLRLGRGDRRGALRLATFVFVVNMVVWLFMANHTNGLMEWSTLSIGLATALYYSAVFIWLFYIAIEPFVRRDWPELLVSWARLLDGRWQDPRVGRDLLAGALVGSLVVAMEVARTAFGIESNRLDRYAVELLTGSRHVIAATLVLVTSAVANGMTATVLLLLLRSLVRNRGLAASLLVIVLTIFLSLQSGLPLKGWVFALFQTALFVSFAVRFGLLSSIAAWFTYAVLTIHPITADSSAFYFGNGMLMIAVVVAVGLYGWYTCVGPPRAVR
jgi:serine/threonine-protein kinase